MNNAAFGPIGALEDTRPSTLEHTLAVNLVGPHRLVRRVLPAMRRGSGGVIVNVGSINGFVAEPMLGAYSASKAASLDRTRRSSPTRWGISVSGSTSSSPGASPPESTSALPGSPAAWTPRTPTSRSRSRSGVIPTRGALDAFGDPDIVATAIVEAIEEPSTPLFLPVPEDTRRPAKAHVRDRRAGPPRPGLRPGSGRVCLVTRAPHQGVAAAGAKVEETS